MKQVINRAQATMKKSRGWEALSATQRTWVHRMIVALSPILLVCLMASIAGVSSMPILLPFSTGALVVIQCVLLALLVFSERSTMQKNY